MFATGARELLLSRLDLKPIVCPARVSDGEGGAWSLNLATGEVESRDAKTASATTNKIIRYFSGLFYLSRRRAGAHDSDILEL
jgi:hypothetical protein